MGEAMAKEVSKIRERKLLLERVFPTPYAGYEDSLVLFKIGREKGDPYCLRFDERGYTPDYKRFDSKQVIERVASIMSDSDLATYAKKYREKLSEFHEFKGKYYTYDPKTKELTFESRWDELKEAFKLFYNRHGRGIWAVLKACWEANVKYGKKWDNYHLVMYLAKDYGLRKGWFRVLTDLSDRIGLINRHKGDLYIPEELLPLVENILEEFKPEE